MGNHCPVVVSVAPKVENLVRIFNLETDQLTEHSLDENFTRRNSILSTLPEAGGIVEDFWIIVALHFVEILLDFGHLALFVLTCLVPWRIPQLVCSIMESNVRSTWREATELYELHCDAQRCLTEYLIGMAPLANSLAKSVRFGTGYRYSEFVLFTEEDYSYDSYYYRHSLYGPLSYYNVKQVHSRLKRLEDVTFKRFERDSEKVIQRADKGNEEIRQFGNLLTQHREAQLMRLVMWGFRCSANMMKPEEISRLCEALQLNQNEVNFSFGGLLAEIVSVFDLSLAYREKNLRVKLDEHLRDLRAHVDQEYHTLSFRKRWNGLFTRSKNDLRKIIRLVAARALRDLGLLLLTLMIFVTMIRVLPLLRDLYEANSWSITSEPTQRIILKHIRGVAQDLKRFGICVFFVSLVFLLGVGVPSFLRKIPRRLKSLEDVTNCAKEHVDETFRFLCELLTLFAAWRTYKLVVTAGVYAILVPPACIAEAIPRRVSSVQFRFIFGIFVWFGLLFGAVYLSFNTDRNHNWSENSDVSGVRQGFLKLFGILMGVILLAACSLSRRSNYTSPIKDSTTGFVSPSWSHILSLLLGPFESLQLASVVLYFFWNGTRDYVAGEGGSFTFPVVYLFDPNTADAYGYSLAMGLAAGCVLLWVVIVSLPLVYDSDDKSAIRSIQNNPAFDALYTLFSRVIFVSIVATLMRPYSCVTGGSDSPLVLSTDPFQECGGNDSPQNRYASNVAASIYLLFFMLTSTIFHSDAPDVLSVDEREWDTPVDSLGKLENLSVKFAPLYAIVIRLGQFLICYLCFGLASKSDRREDLIAIIVLNFLMFLWAGFYPFGRGCSIPCITTLRAVGFLVVMWASIVCYCRDSLERMNSEVAWTGYVGLLIVVLGFWVAGVAAAVLVQKSASKKWQASLREGGLQSALEELISTADKVFVEDAIGGGTTEGKLSRKEQFISEIQQTLTASALGQLLVRFEEKILAERLSYDFIDNRPSWRRELLSQSLSYQTIISHARILRSSITTKAPLALLNKHVLAGILENKLPEYVAWEVYRYLYDVEPIRKLLAPLMVLTADGHRPQAVQQYYGRYTWYTDEAYTVTLLRLTKSLLFETIRSNRPQPTAPPVIATKAVRSVVESSAPPLRSSLLDVQPLVMDREWACQDCTLINPSSRNYCDACGKERPRRSW